MSTYTDRAAAPPMRARARGSSRRPRRWMAAIGIVLGLLLVAVVIGVIPLGGVLRARVESTLNENLEGYTVALPELRLHILGLGLRLLDLKVTQDKHPEPPVADIGELSITVDWGSLLRGDLVADLELASPRLHIDRRQLTAEAADEKDLSERGWQEAVEDIYPLEINRFDVTNGSLTYIDGEKEEPVQLDDITIVAENVRNVRSPDDVYPSEVLLEATLFETGRLRAGGKANFLAEPTAAFDVDVELADVPLESLDPVSDNVNVRVRSGVLAAKGHVEYAPSKQNVYLERVRIDDTAVEYVHRQATAAAEAKRVEKVQQAAKDVSNEAETRAFVDVLEIRGSELGYRDESEGYRLFVSEADITVQDIGSRQRPEPARVDARGLFMGAGQASLRGTFQPVNKSPQFDVDLRIENTPVTTMNDLLQAYGNFDVVRGQFAFYSEIRAGDGRVDGYVKPLFTNLDVYDRRQDQDENVLKQVYEGVVGGISELLENPREDVAAKVDVSGPLDNPDVSTLDTIISLIQNAFFKAILPGFERNVGKE